MDTVGLSIESKNPIYDALVLTCEILINKKILN